MMGIKRNESRREVGADIRKGFMSDPRGGGNAALCIHCIKASVLVVICAVVL